MQEELTIVQQLNEESEEYVRLNVELANREKEYNSFMQNGNDMLSHKDNKALKDSYNELVAKIGSMKSVLEKLSSLRIELITMLERRINV